MGGRRKPKNLEETHSDIGRTYIGSAYTKVRPEPRTSSYEVAILPAAIYIPKSLTITIIAFACSVHCLMLLS